MRVNEKQIIENHHLAGALASYFSRRCAEQVDVLFLTPALKRARIPLVAEICLAISCRPAYKRTMK